MLSGRTASRSRMKAKSALVDRGGEGRRLRKRQQAARSRDALTRQSIQNVPIPDGPV
jgi:hypothetical protein